MGLTRLLAKKVANYQDPESLGSRLRARRIAPLTDMIQKCYEQHGSVRIVDIGGTKHYWRMLPEQIAAKHNVRITIVNPRKEDSFKEDNIYEFVQGDGCNLSRYQDETFDIVHSNSVIEHVGDWQRMKEFALEVRRLAPNYFVQTPNYWFPVEPHFMVPFYHWLPRPARASLIMRYNLGQMSRACNYDEAIARVESARLLNEKMMRSLFPDAILIWEKILGFAKSVVAIRSS